MHQFANPHRARVEAAQVSPWQRNFEEVGRRTPTQCDMVDEHDIAAPFANQVAAQLDDSIIGFANEPTHPHRHAEFFGKLTHQRLLGRFVHLDLAPRKFPIAAMRPPFALKYDLMPVADEQFVTSSAYGARISSARRFKSLRSRANSGAITWSTPAS